jgi:hypothetical protein
MTMQKCNWCSKSFENGPFSNYCSKKCEKEAVANGEKKGVNYSSGIWIIIIIMIIFYSFKKFNSGTSYEVKQNSVERSYSAPSEHLSSSSKEENNSDLNTTKDNQNTQTEKIQESSSNESTVNDVQPESAEQISTSNIEEIATSLLREGKSVREVADSTGMSRQEVRKLKRSL